MSSNPNLLSLSIPITPLVIHTSKIYCYCSVYVAFVFVLILEGLS